MSAVSTGSAPPAAGPPRAPVDTGLVEAVLDPLGMLGAGVRAARAVVADPVPAARSAATLGAGVVRTGIAAVLRAAGLDAAGPVEVGADHRHRDPAWRDNAWYWSCRQQHALLAGWAQDLARDLALDPVDRRKIEFLVQQLTAATDPANWPLTNPQVPAAALRTGGASLARGLRNLVRDVVGHGGLPRQVPVDGLVVGRDLAATPGKVVYRNELIELIQFAPQTVQVHRHPLLLSPPWINKYYVMDLAPGRSFAEWAVRHGRTVFAISYRNPGAEHAGLGLGDYLRDGPLTALDVVAEITGAPTVDVAGLCLGGTLAVAAAAWAAARGEPRIGTVTLLNTLLDFTEPGPLGVFADPATVERLDRLIRATGYLPAPAMKAAFDSLRPTDLVWRYVLQNWWLGEDPPAFDLLSWNADSTRMPAAMQTEYLRSCYVANLLVAGKMELAGERIDLGAVRNDTYVVGAEADHIAPWASVYSGARHLGGQVRFVLTTSGHIAGVVNPPSPRSAHRRTDRPVEAAALPQTAQQWLAGAERRDGSWWEDWARWGAERAGEPGPPPPMGGTAGEVLGDAPGRYVLQR